MDGKEELKDNEDELWDEGTFMETLGPRDIQERMKTFCKGHDKDMNYNCRKCNKKISAHNRDWHNNMCDDCFNNQHFKED